VPYCCAIREKLERQRAEQRLKQTQLMRRRMAAMQRGMAIEAGVVQMESVPLSSSMLISAAQAGMCRDKNAQFAGMTYSRSNVQSPAAYYRTVQSPYGAAAVSQTVYERHEQFAAKATPPVLNRPTPAAGAGGKVIEMMTLSEFSNGTTHRELNEAAALQKRGAAMMNSIPTSSLYDRPHLTQQHVCTPAAVAAFYAYEGAGTLFVWFGAMILSVVCLNAPKLQR